MTDIFSSRPFLGDDVNAIYRLLHYLPIDLCVDVGAASGGTAKLIKRNAANARVFAFEPFPGNLSLFEDTVRELTDVTLWKGAVSSTPGKAELIVAPSVAGTEPGWEDRVGYSSGSKLALGVQGGNRIQVDCYALDDVVEERISFLKIDVQGTERDVLESARRHFANADVDLCFVEFNGELEICEFFTEFGFSLFSTPLLLAGSSAIAESKPQFELVRTKNMSNGQVGECVWDHSSPAGAIQFADHVKGLAKDLGRTVQTDLVCVASHYMSEFLAGAAKLVAADSASGRV